MQKLSLFPHSPLQAAMAAIAIACFAACSISLTSNNMAVSAAFVVEDNDGKGISMSSYKLAEAPKQDISDDGNRDAPKEMQLSSTGSCEASQHHSAVDHGLQHALQRARALEPPQATSTVKGEYEGEDFWNDHDDLLQDAWKEWEADPEQQSVFSSMSSTVDEKNVPESVLLDSALYERVEQMRESPSISHEESIKELWTEVAPGVYRGLLLSLDGVRHVRSILDAVQHKSSIPRRRPNGMNKHGIIVNDIMEARAGTGAPGGVSLESLSNVIHRNIIDGYVRPLGRALFPTHIGRGDDQQAYAFTIRYSAEEDMELKEHNNASVVTLNVNLNLPEGPPFEGSSIYFVDPDNSKNKTEVTFSQPGMALIHLGQVRHASLPITKGERQNLVVWLFGDEGYVRIARYDPNDETDRTAMMATPVERWASRMAH